MPDRDSTNTTNEATSGADRSTPPASAAQRPNAAEPTATLFGPAYNDAVIRRRWQVVVVGSALAGAALLADQTITDWLIDPPQHNTIWWWLQRIFGLGGYLVILAVLTIFPNRKRISVGFVVAMLFSTFLTHILKWFVGRARPQADHGPFHFVPLTGDGDFESFPSGHSSAVAALAMLLGFYFPKARFLFWTLAILTGFERVLNNKHYTSDVLFGFMIGLFAVWGCLRAFGPKYYDPHWPANSETAQAAGTG